MSKPLKKITYLSLDIRQNCVYAFAGNFAMIYDEYLSPLNPKFSKRLFLQATGHMADCTPELENKIIIALSFVSQAVNKARPNPLWHILPLVPQEHLDAAVQSSPEALAYYLDLRHPDQPLNTNQNSEEPQ